MSWILIAFLAAAFSAAATMTNKYVFARLSKRPVVQVIAGGIVGVLLSNVVMLFHEHGTLSFGHAVIAILAGVCFGLSLTTNLHAIKHGTVSQVGPLRFLTPVMVALIAAVFLGETLALQVYFGISLILIGAVLLDGGKLSELHINKVLGFMLLSCFFLAIQQTLTKYLLRFSDAYTVLLYVRLGLLLFTVPFLIKNFGLIKEVIRPHVWRNLGILSLASFFGTGSMFLIMFAAVEGPVTVVSALASLAPFFILFYVITLSRRFPDIYKDGLNRARLIRTVPLVALMFVGVLLVL